MKKLFLTMLLISAMVLASVGMATAESILFPYVAYSNTVDTLVSVINTSSAPRLYYQYWTKAVNSSNPVVEVSSGCQRYSFPANTSVNDIVTFAVGGNSSLGGGNAMFGDQINYLTTFREISGGPRFGYLLVQPANIDGTPTTIGGTEDTVFNSLDGEATLYDIATGAMWGYRALSSQVEAAGGAVPTILSYSFATNVSLAAGDVGNIVAGNGVTRSVLHPNTTGTNRPKITIYPPNQFTGRLFVTPVAFNPGNMFNPGTIAGTNTIFHNSLMTGNVALVKQNGASGMYDRDEFPRDGGTNMTVRCVGRIDIATLLSPLLSSGSPFYTTGGFSYVDVDVAAWVADLKFGAITGMTGMVNDGKVVLDHVNR